MSYYYNYYIGYKLNGKIYPLGPYNNTGKLQPAVWQSRSFASDLYRLFNIVPEEMISDELRKEFEYEDWNGEKTIDVKYLPIKDLPTGDYVKSGYFLIEDVMQYEKNHDAFDLFYNKLSPEIYIAKMNNELKFGPNKPKKDCEGYEYTEPNASDYMYYMYPDYNSKEYEAHILRHIAENLRDYSMSEDVEYLILETEG